MMAAAVTAQAKALISASLYHSITIQNYACASYANIY